MSGKARVAGSVGMHRSEAEGTRERLKRLNALKEQGLITESEYAEKRSAVLSEL